MSTVEKQIPEFELQSGPRACFPACFRNALRHFGISVAPEVSRRLAVFDNGTESCTVRDAPERLEVYERSIHKFASERRWACCHARDNEHGFCKPDKWAKYLMGNGICLELRNGPIEQRNLLTGVLIRGEIAVCET
jgi:hypothetical protein